MSEWKEYRLDEVGLLQRGRSRHRPRYAFHLYGGKYPFIQTGEIKEAHKYIDKFEQTYNEEGLKQSKLWPKGTLCITIAANIAEIAILKFDACFPDSVIGFIPEDSKANLDFIYYSLLFFQKELKHIGEGSVQDNINIGTFQNTTFPLPPLPEQKAIAAVLSSLDDKIDLLHRQNKTLEALAETLFRQWFIVEAQDDWEERKVSDIAEHVKVNVKPSSNPTSIFHHYSIPAFDEGKMPKQEYGSEILSNKYEVFPNTIMVSKLNPRFPRIWAIRNRIETNSICSTEFQIFKPKLDFYHPFLYFLFKSDEAMAEMEMAASGTSGSHQRVKPDDMLNISFAIPSNEKVEEFSNCTLPLLHKKERNKNQIVILEKLRDTLLPKLMSGEVRVSEL